MFCASRRWLLAGLAVAASAAVCVGIWPSLTGPSVETYLTDEQPPVYAPALPDTGLSTSELLLAIEKMPLAMQELSLNKAEAGSFMSIFFLGYLLTQIPGGILADRFGIRKILILSLLLTGGFTLAFAGVEGYSGGLLLRFLAGLGSGAIMATAVKGVYDSFSPANRATAMGVFMTSLPAGLMLANLLSPWVAVHAGWRGSFIVAGCLTLLSMGVAWRLLPQTTVVIHQDGFQPGKTLRLQLQNRRLLITALAGFMAMWGTWGVLTWNNSFLHQGMGLTIEKSGGMMALFGLGALIGQPLAGKLASGAGASRGGEPSAG